MWHREATEGPLHQLEANREGLRMDVGRGSQEGRCGGEAPWGAARAGGQGTLPGPREGQSGDAGAQRPGLRSE